MRLRLEVDGILVAHRELLGMGERVMDLSPAMRDVRDIVYESEKKLFATEGAHGGTAWTPPSAEWTRRKVTLGLDTKTEQATGDLRRSLTGHARGSYSRVRKDGVDVGTVVPEAKWARKRNPLVAPTEGERRAMVRSVQAFVVAGRARSGILAGVL